MVNGFLLCNLRWAELRQIVCIKRFVVLSRSIFLIAVSLFSILVSELWAFDGKYIPFGIEGEGWDCGQIGMDRGAFQIEGGSLSGLEYGCTLSNPTPANGFNATIYDGICAIEGTEYLAKTMLMPWSFEEASGVYVIENGYVQQWELCGPAEPSKQNRQLPDEAEERLSETLNEEHVGQAVASLEGNFDVDAFDGKYLVELGRVWREVYWVGRNNEHFVPGRVEPLSRAILEVTNGRITLKEALEFQNSGGPIFAEFVGRITDDADLKFWADVNFLVGEVAPFALSVEIDLKGGLLVGEAVEAEPDGFDNAYDARVSLIRLSSPQRQKQEDKYGLLIDDESPHTEVKRTEKKAITGTTFKEERNNISESEREQKNVERLVPRKNLEEEHISVDETVERDSTADKKLDAGGVAAQKAERERLEAEHSAENARLAEQYYQRFLSHNKGRRLDEALRWLRKSAREGHAEAQHHLGYVYEKGQRQIQRNIEKAKFWYGKAASQGFEPSVNRLEAIAIGGPAYRPKENTRYVAILKCGDRSITTSIHLCAKNSALTIMKNGKSTDYVSPGPNTLPTDKYINEAGTFFDGQLFVQLPSNFEIAMHNSAENGLALFLKILEVNEGRHWRSILDGDIVCQQSAQQFAGRVYCASPTQ